MSTGHPNNLILLYCAGMGDGKEKGLNHFGHEGLVTKEKITEEEKENILSRLTGTTDIRMAEDCDMVVEAPGFVVNRILIPMVNEAFGIMAEGIASPEDIDQAMMLGANHPMGPLALGDLIGMDVCLAIMDVLYNETGDTKYRAHSLMRKYVRAGWLGRKTGRGVYQY